MYERNANFLLFLLIISFTNGETQDPNQDVRKMCNETNSMDFDPDQISGVWYEVARNPATNLLCVEVEFGLKNENHEMWVNTTYSNTPSYPWVNQTMYTFISAANGNSDGYNISYVNGLTNTSYTTYKLLSTNYTNYAFVCGYLNSSDMSTSFGIVLARNRTPPTSILMEYEEMAYKMSMEFLNGSMSELTQDSTCWANGASTFILSHRFNLALLILLSIPRWIMIKLE